VGWLAREKRVVCGDEEEFTYRRQSNSLVSGRGRKWGDQEGSRDLREREGLRPLLGLQWKHDLREIRRGFGGLGGLAECASLHTVDLYSRDKEDLCRTCLRHGIYMARAKIQRPRVYREVNKGLR